MHKPKRHTDIHKKKTNGQKYYQVRCVFHTAVCYVADCEFNRHGNDANCCTNFNNAIWFNFPDNTLTLYPKAHTQRTRAIWKSFRFQAFHADCRKGMAWDFGKLRSWIHLWQTAICISFGSIKSLDRKICTAYNNTAFMVCGRYSKL